MKKYYKFLEDEQELDKFLHILRTTYDMVGSECSLLYLFSRNKYLSEEDKKTVDLSRSNVVNRQILRNFETETVVKALHKMECAHGAYLDRSGNVIPQEALIPYISYNPVSPTKAFADTQKCFVDYLMELNNREGDKENTYNRLARIDQQYFTQLHHAFSRKPFMDFDFDIPDREFGYELTDHFMALLEVFGAKSHRVMTRSGFHVLVNKSTIKYNYNMDLLACQKIAMDHYHPDGVVTEEQGKVLFEIAKNNNEQLPLAGCYQKDHLVRLG